MENLQRENQTPSTNQQYRLLLAVSEAIVANRDLVRPFP